MRGSYTHHVAPQAGNTPAQEPDKTRFVVLDQKKDLGWWIGTAIVPVLALAIAIVSVVFQHLDQDHADQVAQSALALASKADAATVSFASVPNEPTQFTIQNREDNPITSVYIQPNASRASLVPVGVIKGCQGIPVTLPSAKAPVMYFKDANGQGWEEAVNGVTEPFAPPSSLILILPSVDISTRLPLEGPPQTLTGC